MKNLVVLPLFAVGVTLALSACAPEGGRYIGMNKCSADGSVVWYEYPNAQGSYEGLNNNEANCANRR
jgi:hypothetical protein